MERLVELWYKIPRDREWWVDKISALLSGCSTGCFVLATMYGLTLAVSIGLCFLVARNAAEAMSMGFAWGTSLSIVTGSIGGSAVLALVSRVRGA